MLARPSSDDWPASVQLQLCTGFDGNAFGGGAFIESVIQEARLLFCCIFLLFFLGFLEAQLFKYGSCIHFIIPYFHGIF